MLIENFFVGMENCSGGIEKFCMLIERESIALRKLLAVMVDLRG